MRNTKNPVNDELKELYDIADKVEDSLLSLRDDVTSTEYCEDRNEVEELLETAIENLQKAMTIMDSERFTNRAIENLQKAMTIMYSERFNNR